ncbi:MFS transporter [Salinithrix halophila]|uniref:MFS transporter n=1 Tax=Salinithrix halophila TaxID=1485204 RepID=A0ABV8JFQ8_9BACL
MQPSSNRTRITFSAFYFLNFFGFGGFFPLLGLYFRDVGLTGTQTGMILSLGPVVMVLAQPVWGVICDYTQRSNQVLILTVTMTGMTGLGYLVMDDYGWMLVVAALLAVFQAAIVPIADSITMNYVYRVGGDYGSLRLWGAIGFASAAFVMGKWTETAGLPMIFIGFAAAMGLCALTGLRLPKEKVSFDLDLRTGLTRLMKVRQFPLFLLATFLIFGPVQANNVYFGLLFQDLGGTLAGVGLGFLLAAGSEAPVMRFAGAWIRRQGLLTVALFAALVSAARWMFYSLEPSVFWVYLTTVSQGLSVGLFIPAALQYIRDLAPKEVKTTAISLYSAVGTGLGNWFFTLIGGMILDGFDIFTTYLLYGAFTLCGAGILLWVKRLDTSQGRRVEGSA